MAPWRSARCCSNRSICAKTDGKQEDPFLFRPPVCPPAACFFFLSSPLSLAWTSQTYLILLSKSYIHPLLYKKKQYLPPFSLLLCYTAPGRAPSRLTHWTTRFHCFQTTTAPTQSPFVLLRTSLFFGIVLPGSISWQGPLFQSGFQI